jgi:hypothetical protein
MLLLFVGGIMKSFLDCSTRNPCAARESYLRRPDYRSTRWRSLRAGRRMDVDSKRLNTPLTRASPACFNKPTDVRFWHKADITTYSTNVRLWDKADITISLNDVRFRG